MVCCSDGASVGMQTGAGCMRCGDVSIDEGARAAWWPQIHSRGNNVESAAATHEYCCLNID